MKIAYVVPFRGGRETGIYRKVAEHAAEWTRQGVTVGLFVATGEAAVGDWNALPSTQRAVPLPGHLAATIVARGSLLRPCVGGLPTWSTLATASFNPGLVWTASRIPMVLKINSIVVAAFVDRSVKLRVRRASIEPLAVGFLETRRIDFLGRVVNGQAS